MPGSFFKSTVIVSGVMLGWVASADAQSAPAPAPATVPAPPPQAPPQQAAQQAAASVGTPAVVVDLQAMDGIIGKSVKGGNGDDLGRLIDLLVGANGQIRAAIIDFGGVMGLGSRKVAVDWRTLDFSDCAKGGNIKLSLTRDALRVSPEFRPGEPIVILQSTKPEVAPPPKPPAPVVKAPPSANPALSAPPANPALPAPPAATPLSATPAPPVRAQPMPSPPPTAPSETK